MINQIVTMSEDGGKTFKTVIPYRGVHPDHHAFWINPNDPNHIVDGNDGGIGITRDRGKTWMFDEKLPVGQFYHINVDDAIPYNVMGGMQDNGSWRGPAYTWIDGGIRNFYWESLYGGDGFDVMPDPENNDWVYTMSQGGNVVRANVATGEVWEIQPPDLDTNIRLRFNWNSAIAQDPFDKKTIYFGSQFVHKSTNKGVSWEKISNDLTTNDSAQIDQSKNGGISVDITGAENHCTTLCIEPSSLQKDVIWVTTDDGNVQLTKDGGKTWANVGANIKDIRKGIWIPQIKASKHNAAEAFVVMNDYRRGDFKPYIFRTVNFGRSWTRLVDEKKVTGYTLCIIQDPVEPNLIFVGTEQGLWLSLDNGSTFQQFKNGYPSVSTFDLAIQEREADLCIATFGRSLWVLDDIRSLRKAAQTKGLIEKSLVVFTAPVGIQASYKNTPGYQWSTWGVWDAENKKEGLPISFYIKDFPKSNKKDSVATTDDKKEETKKGNNDSVSVKIYNEENSLIRTLKWKADSGFNRKIWNMDEKGFRKIGSAKPKENAPEPSGSKVFAGNYKVVIALGNQQDSTIVTVKDDPRFEDRTAIKKAQLAMQTRLRKSADKLNDALDKLSDAEEMITKINAQIKGEKSAAIDSINKQTKLIEKEIKTIREFIKGKEQEKQGYGQMPQNTVLTTYNDAQQYIRNKNIAPSEQEMQLVALAEVKVEQAIKKINFFITNTWVNYQKLVESNPTKMFKEIKVVE
jgi:hypothetical protein